MATMRDIFIGEIYKRMKVDELIFFLTADFGAPALDRIRKDFKERFINVGIAEQNLINVGTGLALERFTVYAYAIAPFITMRAYEQIRNNLSLLSSVREINVNIIGVGAGLGYDVSGPTHHCIEDITIIRNLPNILFFSPSDCELIKRFVDYSIKVKQPKYLRFDSKALPAIYGKETEIDFKTGFKILEKGEKICLVSTGYMVHTALKVKDELEKLKIKIGVIDIFILKPLDEEKLFDILKDYSFIISLEEGFVNKGGLDSLIRTVMSRSGYCGRVLSLGMDDSYTFEVGNRETLHCKRRIDAIGIIDEIKKLI